MMACSQPPAGAVQVDITRIEAVASHYRSVVVWFGLQYLIVIGAWMIAGALGGDAGEALSGLGQLGALAADIVMVVYVYMLTEKMGSSAPWAWAIGMFIPCVNILCLLALSSNAQVWCRANGIAVGLLGPSKQAIFELRSRMMAEAAAQVQYPAAAEPGLTREGPLVTPSTDYVRECRAQRMADAEIVQALISAGWSADQAAQLVRNTR